MTVRGARIGADGTFGFFWSTFAAADGTVTMRLPVPRVPGITITVNGIRPG
ncbi:hypothetical protein [Saccharomonospora cyanea]|uniref:hypothetical protein n=1 Tax=Saccharomonospora cyanea TaxID=40989 RepID=UPI0002ED2B54|nr:hypothetical protein [Saccharomonospora cyanea]